ncbi:lytic transglycosylase domain-containing protein [Geotalea sp. SG265]|uniref:lytic transglycosylase domain-containing protein n=1 Tax=Geotalea sp. SG265 TaxID=2922867 RepID=UPI001FAF5732|nr:lytic transglycosylase domain-containing protein [Geotalea sp. SG265]
MAIDRIASASPIESVNLPVRFTTDGGHTENDFEATLAATAFPTSFTNSSPADAGTAAEILRLQMFRSALTLSDADPGYAPLPAANILQQALAAFVEQEKQSPCVPVEPLDLGATMAEKPAAAVPASPDPTLEAIIDRASRRYGVNAGLIKAVIKAESNFNTHAVSPAGAQGLMQLMPATARGLGVKDSFDAEQNIMAGTRFLRDMLNRYGGDVDSALAAYNWGPGNVDRHGGEGLPRETREYLVKVKGYYRDYSA